MAPEELNLEEGNVSESSSETSEEDLQRVREDMTRAHQTRQQIQAMQKQNKQFALMLSLLLQLIDDDKVLNYVFVQLIDQKISIPVIFAQFLPFLRKRIDINEYQPLYGPLRENLPQQETAVGLVARLDAVRNSSAELQQVGVQAYLPFILDYLQWMQVIDLTTLEPEKRTQLEQSIVKELST